MHDHGVSSLDLGRSHFPSSRPREVYSGIDLLVLVRFGVFQVEMRGCVCCVEK